MLKTSTMKRIEQTLKNLATIFTKLTRIVTSKLDNEKPLKVPERRREPLYRQSPYEKVLNCTKSNIKLTSKFYLEIIGVLGVWGPKTPKPQRLPD